MVVNVLDLDKLRLEYGSHAPNTPNGEFHACMMEAVAYIAGEPWSDSPQCASSVIGVFMRAWNDAMNDEDRQQLKPYIPRLVGTTGPVVVERKRSWMALDWLCRVSAPTWLRAIGKDAEAAAIEACTPIVDTASAKAARQALAEGKRVAAAARDAAGAAAWDAAGAAAWAAAWAAVGAVPGMGAAGAAAGAAAGDAAGAAAWDAAGAAARDAAGAAARDAARDAAGDAAGAAAGAAARAVLRPTVVVLQASALELLDRMIAAA